MSPSIRAAACHVSSIFLSAKETTRRAVSLIAEAVSNKANLVVFPESYIPAFPIWSALRPPTENHDFFKRMVLESVYIDGPEINEIRAAARNSSVIVSIGLSEKVRYSSGTLFNSNLIIGPDGQVLVHHRKLMPTFFEKLTWSPGDGYGLRVADTKFGKVGNLICGENTNPLARYSLMAQGEQVHVSTWPAIWPTRVPNDPILGIADHTKTTDATVTSKSSVGRGANYDNVAANRTRAAAHCFEAKCFGILCSAYLDSFTIESIAHGSSNSDPVVRTLKASPRGTSMFLDPTGAVLPSFTIDSETGDRKERQSLQSEEGILYADLDLEDCIEGKQYHDVVGGYQRLEIFDLKVDRSRKRPITFTNDT